MDSHRTIGSDECPVQIHAERDGRFWFGYNGRRHGQFESPLTLENRLAVDKRFHFEKPSAADD